MQVKEENGNYICLKHNQIVVLVVMDERVSLENKMLCNMCIAETRSPLNQALPVQQAQEMINEKLNQKTEGQDERITQKLNRLRTLVLNMNELRQQLLKNIDIINRQIDQWIYDLLNQMKKENIDLIKGLQLLQKEQEQVKVESNNTYINKIDQAFQKLLNIDGIQKCYQDLMNINNEQIGQSIKQQLNSQQIIKKQLRPVNYKLINQVKQDERSQAIAFNNSGSIMIAGSDQDIKVWQFDKGKMTELKVLKGEGDRIKFLLFSKKNQWFISGDDDGIIKCWKKGKDDSEWLSQQAEQKHIYSIRCIILTNNEEKLISGSYDNTIIVWSVNYQTNQIKYQYSLENKHSDWIQLIYQIIKWIIYLILIKEQQNEKFSVMINLQFFTKNVFECVMLYYFHLLIPTVHQNISENLKKTKYGFFPIYYVQILLKSRVFHKLTDYYLNQKKLSYIRINLNESETLLVSCSEDKQLILWTKEQNNKWIYKNSVKLSNRLSRVCFVEENQLLVQQDGRGFTNVFRVVNQQLQEQEDLKITLNVPKEDIDYCLFPTIYNKSKEIIIQKSHEYVYIIRKQSDGTFKVEGQAIYCETDNNYGNLTQDGEYLVIWNDKTIEFRIYKISYG